MNPLLILIIGVVVVVVAILVFRLHAFLALIIAALFVAMLTSPGSVYQHVLNANSIRVDENDRAGLVVRPRKNQKVIDGRVIILRKDDEGQLVEIGEAKLTFQESDVNIFLETGDTRKGIRLTSNDGSEFLIQRGDRFLHHTQMAEALAVSGKNIAERIGTGFGNTCLKIGIMIAMASIIGQCLMQSGAAERIVLVLRQILGEKNAPAAFIASGFTLGIPVFFETVFYLMIPLGKALYLKTRQNYLLYVLAIIAGASMAHSLVPPTPGPLFVAQELGIDLGMAILCGLVVGAFTVTAGFTWALFINSRITIPLRESADLDQNALDEMAQRKPEDLPGLFGSLLPIAIPMVLLAGGTMFQTFFGNNNDASWAKQIEPVVQLLGNKDIALSIAALCGILLLASRPGVDRFKISTTVQAAIADAGAIVLITAAGGAFGHVLRQTGIAGSIEELMPAGQASLIVIGFLICAVVRTAQGSSTVAMITAVGVVAPLVAAQELTYHPVYIALAIGCGSKPISWMNDSGFWVISKMSGLTEGEMLKTNTIMGIIMGLTGLAVCLIGAKLLPLV